MPPEPTPRAPEPKPRLPFPGPWNRKKEGPGWNVSPGDDGRGGPRPPSPMRRWRLWPILVALLVVNYWAASTFPDKPARARIAYSPQFLSEVKSNNVSQVTITDQSIEGEFKRPVTIGKTKFSRFSTTQPALPTDNTLLSLLKARNVQINANPPDSGRGLLGQILLGFGPTLL
ncbi:MAG: cell division protease FtsH, partial [Gaiellales bacterium]|nr:cell division protease FtsH [Gaiellales bacterium]